ncbi:MAG: nucleoside kinase [Clostridiales bacterium]|jgi:uridine kinase|nr:nucleoside kinase [Clostridiales bacterium]
MKQFTVTFENGDTAQVDSGTTLLELADQFAHPESQAALSEGQAAPHEDHSAPRESQAAPYADQSATREGPAVSHRVVAAILDNAETDLSAKITRDARVRFLDVGTPEGHRVYERSMIFMLARAVKELYPDRKVVVRHSVRFDIYFEIIGDSELLPEELAEIERCMRAYSARKLPFVRTEIQIGEAERLFAAKERHDLYDAIRERHRPYVAFYEFDGMLDYSYGHLVPDSGCLTDFTLLYHYPGAIVTLPKPVHKKPAAARVMMYNDRPKLLSVFAEYKNWGRILGVESIGAFNKIVRSGGTQDIIRVAEALSEKKISQIADAITGSAERKKIVLVSGPSSSGKTTFANRLSIQLRVNGYVTSIVSMDDYFLNREDGPRDENGAYDFECPEALDIELFMSQMKALINGQSVSVPIYNFKKGRREELARPMRVGDGQIMIVEGIHGLNPKITAAIPKEHKYKIYISALTTLNIDDHNRIPTTDSRLIRRIVRDHQFRASKAIDTIRMWPTVRAGEEAYIFPYQESCDSMFNSGLIYELGAMKQSALPLLGAIGRDAPEYPEAVRLAKFISYFAPIPVGEIPANSILREFLGGSCFHV